MKITTFSYSLSGWPSTLEKWESSFLNELEQAVKDNADIILYPELFLVGVAQYFSGDLNSQLNEISQYTEVVLKPKIEKIVSDKNIFMCLGTGPRVFKQNIFNTSWIWNNGSWAFQDKIHLTPWETSFSSGDALTIFKFRDLKIAVLICFDVEQPTLCSRLKDEGIHLLLVPSATVDKNGSQRVNRCASARSIELGAAVITAPLIGKSTCELVDENEGRQGFFLPAQAGIKGEQESYSLYSEDEKVISHFEIDDNALLELKKNNGETKPFLVTENNNVKMNIL